MTARGAKTSSSQPALDKNPYKVFLKSMLDGFLLTDQHGQIVDVNPAYRKMVGYSRKALLAMNVRDLDTELDEAAIAQRSKTLFEEGKVRFRTTHKSTQGATLDLDVSMVLVDIGDEKQYAIFMHDRTEELRAAQAAAEHHDLYRNVFQNASVGIGIAELNGELLSWNEELLKMSGYSDADVRKIKWVSNLYYDAGERDRILNKLEKKGRLENEVLRFKKKGGGFFTTRLTLRPITVASEKRMLAIMEDISATIEQQRALAESEELYRTLINTSPDAIMAADVEGSIILVSPTALKIFGYRKEKELLGKSSLSTLAEKDHERAMRNYASLLETGSLEKAIYKFVRKDGSTFMGEFSAACVDGPDGQPSIVMATIRDISDRIQATQTLERQLKELRVLHAVSTVGARRTKKDLYLADVIAVITESLYSDHLGFLFLDEKAQVVRPHIPSYRGVPGEKLFAEVPLKGSVTGRVVSSGKAVLLTDVRKDKDFRATTTNVRSELCVPIHINGHTIGAINAESKKLNFFSEQDQSLLSTIADQVGIVIERLNLFNAERDQRELAEALQETTASLTTIREYGKLLESILNSVGSVVPHHASDIMVRDKNGTHVVHTRGYSKRADRFLREFEKEAGSTPFVEAALKKGSSILIADTYEEPQWMIFEDTAWIRSYIAAPLRMRGEIIGILNLSSAEPNFYDQDSLERLEAFANQTSVAIDNAMLFSELEQSNAELSRAYDTTLEGWSHALDLRDRETEGHSQRVADMALTLAHELKIAENQLINIRRGALLHDIGKVGIPDAILHKADSLDEDEWAEMKRHPEYAKSFLKDISFLKKAAEIPCFHHEKWDGSGYPNGLSKEAIPISARLFAVVDVWDALRSDRPYRKAWSKEKALAYIASESGRHFDPQVVDAFFKVFAPDWKPSNRKKTAPKSRPAPKAREKEANLEANSHA